LYINNKKFDFNLNGDEDWENEITKVKIGDNYVIILEEFLK
jgi:hypothetical protein